MFFQPQLVRDHPENRLETDGEQRQAGENEAGFSFIQADNIRQPDRQKRKAGGHDEEVEKEEQPENPEVGVVFVGTDGRVHYIFLKKGRDAARYHHTRCRPIRMALSGSRMGSASPACCSHSPLTVCGVVIHAGSFRMVWPPSPVI